jgi:hypothetical protein
MDIFAAFHTTTGAVVIGAGSPWSSTTVGAAARAATGLLAKYQGVDVNTNDMGLRIDPTTVLTIPTGRATWLGTRYLSAANTIWWTPAKFDDISNPAFCGLWNRFNQKRLCIARSDPSGSWTVGQTWNASHFLPGSLTYWIDGMGNEPFDADYYQYVQPGASTSGFIGIGHNQYGNSDAEYGYVWPSLVASYRSQLKHKKSTLGLNFVAQLAQMIIEAATLAGGTPNNMLMLQVDL